MTETTGPSYAHYETRFGPGWVAWDENGLLEVGLPGGDPPPIEPGDAIPEQIRDLCHRLTAAWKGEHVFEPDDELAERAGTTPLTVDIYRTVGRIPAGATMTYGQVAAAVGRPGAARAVGAAMARNPYPLLIPCHRVLASDGSLGGYAGGLHQKEHLLGVEGRPTLRVLEPETMGDG